MPEYNQDLFTNTDKVLEEDSTQRNVVVKAKSNPEISKSIKGDKVGSYATLYNENCEVVLKDLEDKSVDLLLTDPPYNIGQFMHKRNTNLKQMRDNHFAFAGWDNMDYEEWYSKMDVFFKESARVVKDKGTLLMFMSLIKIETIISLAQKYGFYYKTVGVWHKTNPMPRNMNLHFVNSTEAWVYFINNGTTGTFNNNGKVLHDFIETSLTTAKEKKFGKHPTQKPIKLITQLIKVLSDENDIVLDTFMGSGTTGVACELLNRRFIGIELEEKYFELTKKRIEKVALNGNY